MQETELVFEASPALPPAFAEPVQETDLVFETAEPRLAQPSLVRRTLRRIAERKDKGTLAVWCFFGCVGLLVVLQRNGIFYTVANFIGQGREYVALETELLGGPGEGTQRGAEALLRASLPSGQVPFSEVSARVKQENP